MRFPLDLRFKLLAIASQISVRDSGGGLLCYVKQKAFKLKEAVTVYGDEAQTQPLFTIAADRVIDISAQYHIADREGRPIGVVTRRGMRSFWRAEYDVSRDGSPLFFIREENPWVKVADNFLGEIPLLGILTSYVFHPAYRIAERATGKALLRVVKRPAFFEGRYQMEQVGAMDEGDQQLALLAVLMMLLLERRRG